MPAPVDVAGRHRAAVLTWLAHPVTVLALALLALNDHVLKAVHPGPVTGKLSDLAGLLVAPPVLATVAVLAIRRLPAAAAAHGAIVAVGVGFALTKAYPAGAAAASALWSLVHGPSVIRADRTDLAALPILAVAAWCAGRARRRPDPGRAWRLRPDLARRLAIFVVLPAAALAMAATSAVYYPSAVTVVPWRSGIAVGVAQSFDTPKPGEALTWRVSEDAATWRDLTPEQQAAFDAARPSPVTAQCAPAPATRECYRVVPSHLRVERSLDGGATWSVSWEVTDRQRELLAHRYPEVRSVSTDLASHALAISAGPGGYVVVVANGRDGLAVRDVRGQWRRTGFAHSGQGSYLGPPQPLDGTPQPLDGMPLNLLLAAVLAALLAGILTVGIAVGGATVARRPALIVFITLLAVTAPLAWLAVLGLYGHDGMMQTMAAATAIGLALVAGACSVGIVVSGRHADAVRDRWVGWAVAAALVTVAAVMVPTLSVPWLAARPYPALGAVIAVVLGVAVAAAARRDEPPPGSSPLRDPPYPRYP
ncbi:hypothetical protein WEI85_20285 [Actinomycetes bacterium KLBMP 9797]